MLELDRNDPVVKLCAAGIAVELQGRAEDARALYEQAWRERNGDLQSCIAAHYVARLQPTAADNLRWNQVALDHAAALDAAAAAAFMPSLHLNLGKSLEDLGRFEEAGVCYQEAESSLSALPDDGYGDMVRGGVARGQQRIRIALGEETAAPGALG